MDYIVYMPMNASLNGIPFVEVQPDWKGQTVAILASGPSLAGEDFALLAGLRTIVLNDAAHRYPVADIFLLCDKTWIPRHPDLSFYKGPLVICLRPDTVKRHEPRMVAMRRGPHDGISAYRGELNGRCTAVSHAVNLAVHKGASRILLLGVDLQPGPKGERHYHNDVKDTDNATVRYHRMAQSLETQAGPLKKLGIEVINCSPRSCLDCYKKAPLSEAVRGR